MIRQKNIMLLTFALLLGLPQASAEGQGEVRVESIEAASGSTSGNFVALLIDHDTLDLPVAAHGFRLDGSDVVVTSNHVQAKVRTTSTPATPHPVLEGGSATIVGVESRPDLHFWITPLDNGSTIEVQQRACTTLQPPIYPGETRRPAINGASNPLTIDTNGTAQVASCTDALAIIRGDFAVTAWEWDMTVNGERVNSGVNDTARNAGLPGTGAGSADELHIQARDATLTIPLTAKSYELFIAHPDLDARELLLKNAEGTLPGVLERLDGADVELVGDYAVTIDTTRNPFTATVAGTTVEARSGDAALAMQTTAPPGFRSPVAWIVTAASIALVLALAWNAARPWRVHRALQGYTEEVRGDGEPQTVRERMAAGLYLMADRDVEQGRFRRAIRRGRLGLLWNPTYSSAAFAIGGALSGLKRYPEARDYFTKSLELAKSKKWRALSLMAAAESEIRAGRVHAAVPYALQGHREHPVIAAQAARGAAWRQLEDSHAALLAAIRSGASPDATPYVT